MSARQSPWPTDLADTLGHPDIGGFQVTSVVDATAHEVRVALEDFLIDRDTTDLLLVYLSCHRLLDARGRLHFAASDTFKSRLAATGIESRRLLDQMEDCRARRQVLILDCCFSGAFDRGTKSGRDIDLGSQLGGHSRGRVVLTASRASEYSFEGEPLTGSLTGSVFTSVPMDGLRSGKADLNNDGYIGVDEAYNYAFEQTRAKGSSQTPQRWVYGAEGATIILARSTAGITVGAAPLPEALRAGLDNPLPHIRLGAVNALEGWLRAPDPAKMLAARQALHRVAESDVSVVAAAARALLEAQTSPRGRANPVPRPRLASLSRYIAAATTEAAASALTVPPGKPPAEATTDDGARPDSDDEPLTFDLDPEELEALTADYAPRVRRVLPMEDEPSMLVARYLFPTERYRGEWVRHPIFLAKRTILGVGAALLAFFGIGNLPSYVDPADLEWLPPSSSYWVSGGILIWAGWSLITWRFYRFVLTNKRTMVASGFFVRRVAMMPLLRLTDMKYSQSWLARLLNYGTFRLESAGRIDRMRKIRNIPNPNEIYLRVVEEMYEPAAVEARLSYSAEDYDDGTEHTRP
jgi:hypothetical protein